MSIDLNKTELNTDAEDIITAEAAENNVIAAGEAVVSGSPISQASVGTSVSAGTSSLPESDVKSIRKYNINANPDIARFTAFYPDIESLFQSMPMELKRHSLRVAEYLKALYESAIEIEIQIEDDEEMEIIEKLTPEYMFLIGKYHDIGLALMVDDAIDMDAVGISDEDKIKIRRHTFIGTQVAQIYAERADNKPEIFWKVLIESIGVHHERPDGRGYPHGKDYFVRIPSYIQLLILANLFDGYVAYTRLEEPFEFVYNLFKTKLTELELDELLMTMEVAEAKLKRVFRAHMGETDIIICPPDIIRKRSYQNMFMYYRPVRRVSDDGLMAVEAVPAFYMPGKKEEIDFEELRPELTRAKLLQSVWKYYLYDAADMIGKMIAYGFKETRLRFPIFHGLGTTLKITGIVKKCCLDTNGDPSFMCFSVDLSQVKKKTKALTETLKDLVDFGCDIIVTNYVPDDSNIDIMIDIGVREVSLAASVLDHLDEQAIEHIKRLANCGIRVTADGVDSGDYAEQLSGDGIIGYTGNAAGKPGLAIEIFREFNPGFNIG